MKWPSANEVDFGDFLVVFDFPRGTARMRYPNGDEKQLASFDPQKQTREVGKITGKIFCGGFTIELLLPVVDEKGKLRMSITSNETQQNCDSEHESLRGDIKSFIRYEGAFTVRPKIDGRDAYLEIEITEKAHELAILVASVLVFQRFAL